MSKIQEITVEDSKFKYGFRINPRTDHFSQWEFPKEITKVISWLVTNISEYDGERWDADITLHYDMNPIIFYFRQFLQIGHRIRFGSAG